MAKRVIIGESGGPTPVIDWEVAGALSQGQEKGWEVYGMRNGLEGLLNANIPGNIVDLTEMDAQSFVFNGPGAGLGTTRIKPTKEEYKRIAQNLKHLRINAIIYFGGNDSADQLKGLKDFADDIAAIHGIKTVDNDLPVTHHCPGFGSAALYNATALKNVHNDFTSYKVKANFEIDGKIVQGYGTAPVIIYQVMGRKAGWLAQAAGLAKSDAKGDLCPDRPPHIILSKEVPFSVDEFLDKADEVISRLGEVCVIVQEDLTDAKTGKGLAEIKAENVVLDPHGNIQHGRAGSFQPAVYIAGLISTKLRVGTVPGEIKEAALVPQHIQRSCMMSNVDAAEAYKVGAACIDALEQGLTGKSVILKRDTGKTYTDLTALENIAKQERNVPLEYINGLEGPTQDFIDEFLYLIEGPMGIPRYSHMKFKPVEIPRAIASNPYVKKREPERTT